MPETDWLSPQNYHASRKLEELLDLGSIDTSIPSSLPRLTGLDANWTTGPAVLAGVRNRLVHPRRRQGRVGWSSEVLLDTWLIGSSYLELAILYTLDVQGPIRNRILSPSPLVGATVPPPWTP